MATRQYIGARYVPKFYENSVDGSTQWEPNVVYPPLTYVTLANGHMYISKKRVPATVGTPASNVTYWLDVGDYNGFISQLQDEIDELNSVVQAQTYVLSNFEGDTPEEKLYNALDTIDYGTIVLNMDVEINHTHNLQANGWKDYRRIYIADGNIKLNIDYMFDNGSDSIKSYAAPCFVNCNITSNNKKLFRNSFEVSTPSPDVPASYPFIIGLKFVNCYIYKTIITDSNAVCLQSCHAINCEFRECDHIFNAKAYWDLRLISNQFERTTDYIVKCNENELASYDNLYSMHHCVIESNVIEYTGGRMFTFGKATDIRIINNYFEENAIPYCIPRNKINVFEFTSNYVNEIVANPNDNYVIDAGNLSIITLIIDKNSTVLANGVQMVFPDHINNNASSVYVRTSSTTPTHTIKLESTSLYLLTWTRNGGTDFYIEFISHWVNGTDVSHVVNPSTYISTSIDSSGNLEITTSEVGQLSLLKLS